MVVYVREAHASDSDSPVPMGDQPVVETPLTMEERIAVAQRACTALELSAMTLAIDTIDDATERAYAAAPDRLYLVDGKGKVAYAGGPGPSQFNPDELEDAVRELLELAPIERKPALNGKGKGRRRGEEKP